MGRMRARHLPLLLPLLTLSGCCSMARLFCGPDRTEWVPIDYSSPEAAVRTLLEALRRDDAQRVYESLSNGYRERLNLDLATAQLAWPRFTAANPGLHVAGYAAVPPARRTAPDRAVVTLDVEGHTAEVALVRSTVQRVRYRRPPKRDGSERERGIWGDIVRDLPAALTITSADEASTLTLAPVPFPHQGVDELTADQIEAITLEQVWKVDDVRGLEPAR